LIARLGEPYGRYCQKGGLIHGALVDAIKKITFFYKFFPKQMVRVE